MIKVGYILDEFPSRSEFFILREILALREAGVDIVPLALRAGPPEVLPPRAHALLTDTVYPSRSAAAFWPRLDRLLFAHHPARFIREAQRRRLSHLHAHFAFRPATVARRMARALHIPFSVAVHARDLFVQAPDPLRRRLAGAAAIITCTNYNQAYLAHVCPGLDPTRMQVIRHGVDLHEFTPLARPGSRLVAIGRLETKKGFHTLIEACRILKNRGLRVPCTIVGEGTQRARLAQMIQRLGLQESLHLTGYLPQGELRRILLQAMAVVAPCEIAPDGDRDGIPNVLLEAMALGIPVVSTRIASIPELVDDGRTGLLVEPGQAQDLAAAIERLARDPLLCRTLGANGRHTIEQSYVVQRNIQALIPIFHSRTALNSPSV